MHDSLILNNQQIEQKVKRIAYQILEANSSEDKIVLAGINGNGYVFAERIKAVLEQISKANIILCEVLMDKKNPLSKISTTVSPDQYKNKSLVLVDDVLASGTTLMYGIKHFLDVPLKQFKTAVLVNRNHKKYPVKADFKGISLSTTLKSNITVEFSSNESKAFLD